MLKVLLPICFVMSYGLVDFWWAMWILCAFVVFMDMCQFRGGVFSMLFGYSDRISLLLVVLRIWVGLAGYFGWYGSGWFNTVSTRKLYSLVLGFLILCLFFSFFRLNSLVFYLFFELSLIPILLIIIGWGYQPERLQAGLYMMLYTLFGSIPLLFGLIYMYLVEGTRRFSVMRLSGLYSGFWGGFFVLILFLGFLIKTPVYYFHLWLPKAHVEAPTTGSMVLAGVLLKLGRYGLIRFRCVLQSLLGGLWFLLIWFVFLGGMFGGMVAVFQSDRKSVVAYSSVSHMGLLTGGLLSGTVLGLFSGFLVVLCHGLISSLLFYFIGLLYSVSGSRAFASLFGIMFVFPFFGYMMFTALAGNFRVPPFISLLAELGLLAVYQSFSFRLSLVFGVLSYFCAIFCFYLFCSLFLGGKRIRTIGGNRVISVGHYFCGWAVHLWPFFMYLFSIRSVMLCI